MAHESRCVLIVHDSLDFRIAQPWAQATRIPARLSPDVHLAILREPRLEEFPVSGVSNKRKVRLGIRNLAALLVSPLYRPSDADRPESVVRSDSVAKLRQ